MDLAAIPQVVACAYTYQVNLDVRRTLTAPLKRIGIRHSSHEHDFSYFYKGDPSTIVGSSAELRLRQKDVTHWPEAELALVLGRRHEIVGYTLANDFTAIEEEIRGRTASVDGTYVGKVWRGSCSLGPVVRSARGLDVDELDIRLCIERGGAVIYDRSYSTHERLRSFAELPDRVVARHAEFRADPPPSKRIRVEAGFLVEATILLTGCGLIVPPHAYSQEGDVVSIECAPIGTLKNRIA